MTRSFLLTRRSALGFCACIIFASFTACSQQSGGTSEQGRMTSSGPAGLFFMTRYWSFTRTLEKAAWYFTSDGHVYREPRVRPHQRRSRRAQGAQGHLQVQRLPA